MSWWQIAVEVPEHLAETLAALVAAHTGAAVEIQDATTLVRAEPGTARVIAGFAEPPPTALVEALAGWLADLGVPDAALRTRRSDDDSWKDGWRAFFRPRRVSRRVGVRPPWEAPDPTAAIDLVIDPGMAFGTGTHETTRGVLRVLDDLLAGGERPRSVLDVGCGSGILAIAAAKAGVPATGVDDDPVALENAERNVALNDVADRVTLRAGSAADVAGRFDLVLANILAKVLIEIAPHVAARAGRDLVLSGLLERDEPAVRAAYPGFDLVERRREGEWVVLHLRRGGAAG